MVISLAESSEKTFALTFIQGILFKLGYPDSKVHGANMGRQDPGGPHVDPIHFAIWDMFITGTDMKK